LKDNREIEIICKYGNNGKLFTMFLTSKCLMNLITNLIKLLCNENIAKLLNEKY